MRLGHLEVSFGFGGCAGGFLRGMGTVIELGPSPLKAWAENASPWAVDARAWERDWGMIGGDIQRALKGYGEHVQRW